MGTGGHLATAAASPWQLLTGGRSGVCSFGSWCRRSAALSSCIESSPSYVSPYHFRVARFFPARYTKTGETIPNYHRITKWQQNKPNGHNIFQMGIKYINIYLQRLSKIYTNWDLGLKIYHLATLYHFPGHKLSHTLILKPVLMCACIDKQIFRLQYKNVRISLTAM
jgi:hypothetical protein